VQTLSELEAEAAYLTRVRDRLREALRERLLGVYVGGSYALGDYLPGRSDLDLAAVVRSPVPRSIEEAIVAGLRTESLPCPAQCLELVVYREETAASGTSTAEFELNLNTGAGMPLSVQSRSAPGEMGGHWFPIDRSVLSQAGVALLGPPAREVFAPIPRRELLPVLAESARWHREHEAATGNAVLNACRSLRFAEEGRWSSKPAAGRWASERGVAPEPLVSRALKARAEGGRLDPSGVAAFLESVESRLGAH
jgi:hypothetical protein